jgi:hypothetical protein
VLCSTVAASAGTGAPQSQSQSQLLHQRKKSRSTSASGATPETTTSSAWFVEDIVTMLGGAQSVSMKSSQVVVSKTPSPVSTVDLPVSKDRTTFTAGGSSSSQHYDATGDLDFFERFCGPSSDAPVAPRSGSLEAKAHSTRVPICFQSVDVVFCIDIVCTCKVQEVHSARSATTLASSPQVSAPVTTAAHGQQAYLADVKTTRKPPLPNKPGGASSISPSPGGSHAKLLQFDASSKFLSNNSHPVQVGGSWLCGEAILNDVMLSSRKENGQRPQGLPHAHPPHSTTPQENKGGGTNRDVQKMVAGSPSRVEPNHSSPSSLASHPTSRPVQGPDQSAKTAPIPAPPSTTLMDWSMELQELEAMELAEAGTVLVARSCIRHSGKSCKLMIYVFVT